MLAFSELHSRERKFEEDTRRLEYHNERTFNIYPCVFYEGLQNHRVKEVLTLSVRLLRQLLRVVCINFRGAAIDVPEPALHSSSVVLEQFLQDSGEAWLHMELLDAVKIPEFWCVRVDTRMRQ